MATVRRGIHAPGGDRFELRGRFLAHVAQLEFMARLIVAAYMTGERSDHPRFRLLHDELLRHAGFGRLAEVVRGIIALQDQETAAVLEWLPGDMTRLAKIRNEWAHLRAFWADAPVPLADEEIVALLVKVDSGLADLGTGFGVLALGNEMHWKSEEDHARWGEEQAPAILSELRQQWADGE